MCFKICFKFILYSNQLCDSLKHFLEQLQAEAQQLKTILDQINPDFRCDSLNFYDGDSQRAALIGPYCGESILPSPFVSTSNKALIHFQSDLDTTFASYRDFYGFKLQYHPYSKLGFDNRHSVVQ